MGYRSSVDDKLAQICLDELQELKRKEQAILRCLRAIGYRQNRVVHSKFITAEVGEEFIFDRDKQTAKQYIHNYSRTKKNRSYQIVSENPIIIKRTA